MAGFTTGEWLHLIPLEPCQRRTVSWRLQTNKPGNRASILHNLKKPHFTSSVHQQNGVTPLRAGVGLLPPQRSSMSGTRVSEGLHRQGPGLRLDQQPVVNGVEVC